MSENITYRIGVKKDLADIKILLKKNGLPESDLETGNIDFIVAENGNNTVIGCIGVEQFEKDGLLRSFAVDKKFRNRKIGNRLFNRLLFFMHQSGVRTVHLLTTTAEKYFSEKGFGASGRDKAPVSIRSTTEFSSLCPSSSSYMVRKNIGEEAVYYSGDIQTLDIDAASGSAYWSLQGKNLQFTWFDVPANTRFEKHKHESEQITYVLEGELFFELQNSVYKLSKGDCLLIPANKEHKVWTENNAVKAVDAWSPVNEKYSITKK